MNPCKTFPNIKYTNPANPVRNFCKQKLLPLPILFCETSDKAGINLSGVIAWPGHVVLFSLQFLEAPPNFLVQHGPFLFFFFLLKVFLIRRTYEFALILVLLLQIQIQKQIKLQPRISLLAKTQHQTFNQVTKKWCIHYLISTRDRLSAIPQDKLQYLLLLTIVIPLKLRYDF